MKQLSKGSHSIAEVGRKINYGGTPWSENSVGVDAWDDVFLMNSHAHRLRYKRWILIEQKTKKDMNNLDECTSPSPLHTRGRTPYLKDWQGMGNNNYYWNNNNTNNIPKCPINTWRSLPNARHRRRMSLAVAGSLPFCPRFIWRAIIEWSIVAKLFRGCIALSCLLAYSAFSSVGGSEVSDCWSDILQSAYLSATVMQQVDNSENMLQISYWH